MSDKALEPIVSRAIRLNQLVYGKGNLSLSNRHLIHVDGLLDTLLAVYEECNTLYMKKDSNISSFVTKIQQLISEIQFMRVNVSDFEVKKVIGRGNFGEVQLVREKATGDVYAMKVLRKADTLGHQASAFFEEERNIMAKSTSPWLTKLHYAFQDSQHLYFVMEFHPGGDMLSLLEKYDCLTDSMAQFYLAELALAIHSVHTMGYAHRDIKPDNILIDRTGHVKLADFGSASKLNAAKLVTSKIPVGTPDYIAPEVLTSTNDTKAAKKGYGVECDWWSFGIVTYEMLCGVTPFAHARILNVYDNIMNFKKSLQIPDEVSMPFRNLIKGLLADAQDRFGYDAVIDHQVFSDIDWNNILESVPPLVPNVSSQDDTSNFDDFDPDVRPSIDQLLARDTFSGKNLPFVGFTYIAPFDSAHEKVPSYGSPSKLPETNHQAANKKTIGELQNKIASLTAECTSKNAENTKLKNTIKENEEKNEREIFRLEGLTIQLEKEKKELMHLLKLERDYRLLSEKKANQVLRCMKESKRSNTTNPALWLSRTTSESDDSSTLKNLDEALSTTDISSDGNRSFIQNSQRAKSLSPYPQRQVGHSKEMADSMKCFREENLSLTEEIKKMQQKSDKSLEQVEALKDAMSKLEQKLHDTEEEHRRVVVAELKNFEVTNLVKRMENEIEVKQKKITELKDQLSLAEEKYSILLKNFQDVQNKLSGTSSERDKFERLLKSVQKDIAERKEHNLILLKTVESLEMKVKPLMGKSWAAIEESECTTDFAVPVDKNTPILSSKLQEDNRQLQKKIEELKAEIEQLKRPLKESDRHSSKTFEKQLREKDDALSEAKLDLRILEKERKRIEDLMSSFRDSNRELREKLSNSDKLLNEKTKSVEQMETKIKDLEAQICGKKNEINEKIKVFESQKDINQMYVKSQDHYEEMAKQNEKLKYELDLKEKERWQINSELKNVKAELLAKQKEAAKSSETAHKLKAICFDLEEQLKELELIVDKDEAEISKRGMEIKNLMTEKKRLENEKQSVFAFSTQEKQAREQLELRLEELEETLENQQNIHATEIMNLEDQLNFEKKTGAELERHIDAMGDELSGHERDSKSSARRVISLENKLVQIKEEAADLITQVSSLKSSNLKLTQMLENASVTDEEYRAAIQDLENELENCEVKYNLEKVKLQETLSQQAKLIEFLQTKTESMEKKKRSHIVPRMFGKKDNSGGASWQGDALEQERIKCRRLQDQLSQARAENVALRNDFNRRIPKTPLVERSAASIPISPISRALHSALTSSPGPGGEFGSPILASGDVGNRFAKVQGMKHHIPHRFNDITCMKGYKCAACLDSIHFGRLAVKCSECNIVCHTKCASSLPNTCGLPSGFIQHFKSTFHENKTPKTSTSDDSKLEGWIKVPKSNKQGWEKRYIKIEDFMLYLFNDSNTDNIADALDSLDFASKDGEIIVTSAVSATEMKNTAKSDLPFVLKMEFRSFTTCWPSRSYYIMADSFANKKMWVENLEAMVEKYQKVNTDGAGNKLMGESVLKLTGDKVLDINCVYHLDDDVILLGAFEGLFVLPVHRDSFSLKSKIEGIESVYQIDCIKELGLLIFIMGKQRCLGMVKVDSLQASILERRVLVVDKISDTLDCHLFAIQETNFGTSSYLCAASANRTTLFVWNTTGETFEKKKIIETKEPGSCIHFTQSSVIFGSDKFYELDLKTGSTEEFLDCTDSSLAGLVYGASQLKSFPISIINVAASGQAEEYLVCFHEFGVFVDGFGQRTRPDMKWSRLPLSFAYRAPYLFVTHFNSLEVIEILPHDMENKSVRCVMEIANPQYLGPAFSSGSIYVSSSRDQYIEIFCVEGNSAKRQHANREDEDSIDGRFSPSCESKGSCGDGEELDFSFTTSLMQSLEPSCDTLSMTSGGTASSS